MNLNLGCGNRPLKDYINIDFKELPIMWSNDYFYQCLNVLDIDEYFVENSADKVVAMHLLEHFTHDEVSRLLHKIWRILKPGGHLIGIVPDVEAIIQLYKTKMDQGDFSVVDVLHMQAMSVPELTMHKTIWFDEVARYYLTRENYFAIEDFKKVQTMTGCEIRFKARAVKYEEEDFQKYLDYLEIGKGE